MACSQYNVYTKSLGANETTSLLCRARTGAKPKSYLTETHHFFPDPGHCSLEAGYPLPLVCWAAHVVHRVVPAVSFEFIQVKAARLFPQSLAGRLRHCDEAPCRRPMLALVWMESISSAAATTDSLWIMSESSNFNNKICKARPLQLTADRISNFNMISSRQAHGGPISLIMQCGCVME